MALKGISELSTFAQRVKGLRRAVGLNQPELAEKIGVTKALISQIEAGAVKEVKMELLFKMAAALSISARFLATGRGSPIPIGEVSIYEGELIEAYRKCPPEVQAQPVSTAKLLSRAETPVPMVKTAIGLMHK